MDLSTFILEIRLKFNLSQEKLARKLGVSFATINRWESGKARPQRLTLCRLQKFCRINGIEFKVDIQ